MQPRSPSDQEHITDNSASDDREYWDSFARLQGRRIDDVLNERDHWRDEALRLRRSRSWKYTVALRHIYAMRHGNFSNVHIIKKSTQEFIKDKLARIIKLFKKNDVLDSKCEKNKKFEFLVQEKERERLYKSFLIVAELTLMQCSKYRVWQKKDLLERLGWEVDVVDWRDQRKVMSSLQLCTEVIFYRVPAFDAVVEQVQEAHRLNLAPRWEVDDLIFELEEYRQNGNISTLPQEEQDLIFFGVRLFRKCMLACGRGLASTESLAQAMRDAGVQDVGVVENALDLDTLGIVEKFPPGFERPDSEQVWVCYGSGTNTHDADFRQAEQGLLAAMAQDERLCLRVVGPVQISEEFHRFGRRVEQLPMHPYDQYLQLLSLSDISIAPLQDTLFNDCKSNIKFVEASIVGVASVCSPREPFRSVIKHGENGFLAVTPEEWCHAFLTLSRDGVLRRGFARTAQADILARYHPDKVAHQQVAPLYGSPVPAVRKGLRVLSANVYYKPYSFGGATIVAEEIVRGLASRGVEMSVVTTRSHEFGRLFGSLRYTVEDVPVLSLTLPDSVDRFGWMDHPANTHHFEAWLKRFAPDVVHIHSIQGLGLSILRACEKQGVPYIITLHDAWWLCERQFMVKADGKYCFQTRISLDVCRSCQSDTVYLQDRQNLMMRGLRNAALLLCPSETHRQLYIANGFAPEKVVVNRNGFAWPKRPKAKRPQGRGVRFAYVGGTEDIKGYKLLKEAAQKIEYENWSLTLVDNKRNLGYQSIYEQDWSLQGELRVVPAYSQSELDAFYDDVDVLLFPSQWKESYGLTVREALARDVWVVTTAPGGQSEDVVDGVNGTHIPMDGRSEGLEEAMRLLLADPSRFEGYVNPLKDTLCTFDQQTDELLEHIKVVINAPA